MDSKFIPSQVEKNLYDFWEKNGYFTAKVHPEKEPFSIILPPPNANGSLHLGHGIYVYQDIMIRYNKMKGKETFWLLGLDHAGIETQFVFEKHLKKQGKSRFDYDRDTLYRMIWEFVEENKGTIKNQIKRLGFALDWTKEKYTMDPDIVKIVYRTFKQLFDDQLVYRSHRLVNYCTSCGTSYSDLEVNDKEVDGFLYHIKYPVKEGGSVTIATTRPETYFGDVAVMVNPKDKRYKELVGKTVVLPIINREVPIIADDYVDKKFGTGAVKVTPSHDFNDFEVAKRHNLPNIQILGFDGKIKNTGVIDGLRVKAAREETLKKLGEGGWLLKKNPHKMVVKICYRCGTTLEPLPKEQWFIKVKPLADQAVKMVNEGLIQVYPKRFKKQLIRILENFIDWNISRQIVWGIRIPAYQCKSTQKWFVSPEKPESCEICGKNDFVQDEDTFDTWFSSGQWPFATLESISQEFYNYFYPTTVMETGYDILRAWVARMIMLGDYATKKEPFQNVFLHGLLRDKQGQKMSKSKGNVIDPLKMIEQYGADALRAALIFGTKEGNDTVLSEDKIKGMRNFANKIWNMGRFIHLSKTGELKMGMPENAQPTSPVDSTKVLNSLKKETASMLKKYQKYMEKYQFSKALELAYQFTWHKIADYYIEQLKDDLRNGNMKALETLESAYSQSLKMIHPFMPFVTEAAWKVFHGEESSILNEQL